jgi:DNA mismatch repair protein MutS2
MVTIVEMIDIAREGSLCLFDELGAGTDPLEGAALAVAILERVRNNGAKLLATTHYAELKTYALDTPRVENASCEFDVNTLRPTYRLIIGTPGRSNAFLIAQRLGLGSDIISSASRLMSKETLDFERVVEKLEKERLEMEALRAEAEKQKAETEKIRNEALAERERLLEFAEKESERAKKEAARLVMSAKKVSDDVFNELERLKTQKEKELLKRDLEKQRLEMRAQLRGIENQSELIEVREEQDGDYTLPRELRIGDRVLLANTGKEGTVEKLSGKDALVLVGSIRTKIKITALRLVTDLKTKKPVKGLRNTSTSRRDAISAQIDLRGELSDDAIFLLDKYIDDAVLCNLNQITIIHGKGTGALRNAVTAFLKRDKRISSSRPGTFGEGDSGVTIALLKQ